MFDPTEAQLITLFEKLANLEITFDVSMSDKRKERYMATILQHKQSTFTKACRALDMAEWQCDHFPYPKDIIDLMVTVVLPSNHPDYAQTPR
jgi:hypothetical protein